MMTRWLSAAMVFASLTANVYAAEIEFRHINDLFSASPTEDDLYSGALGLSGTVAGWTLDLDEYLFTDKKNGLRFDETYLTVAKDFLGPDSKWQVRARVGAAHVGRGLYGQRLQNFVHSILFQPRLDLPYVPDSRTHAFVRLNVARTVYSDGETTLAPLIEIESSGFKKHARVALGARWVLGERFGLHAEAGARFSDTNFAPLSPWIENSGPTVAIGFCYKDFLDLTWTSNYFGTGDNHWHVTFRSHFGAGAKKNR